MTRSRATTAASAKVSGRAPRPNAAVAVNATAAEASGPLLVKPSPRTWRSETALASRLARPGRGRDRVCSWRASGPLAGIATLTLSICFQTIESALIRAFCRRFEGRGGHSPNARGDRRAARPAAAARRPGEFRVPLGRRWGWKSPEPLPAPRVSPLLDRGAIKVVALPDAAVTGHAVVAHLSADVTGSALAAAHAIAGLGSAVFVSVAVRPVPGHRRPAQSRRGGAGRRPGPDPGPARAARDRGRPRPDPGPGRLPALPGGSRGQH